MSEDMEKMMKLSKKLTKQTGLLARLKDKAEKSEPVTVEDVIELTELFNQNIYKSNAIELMNIRDMNMFDENFTNISQKLSELQMHVGKLEDELFQIKSSNQ